MFEKQSLLWVQVRTCSLSDRGDRKTVKGLKRELGMGRYTFRNIALAAA